MDAQRRWDLLHTALGRWKDSERRDEFLAVKCLKCQNPNESLQGLLLVLAPKLQEGGLSGAQAIAEDSQNAPEQPCNSRAWSHRGRRRATGKLPSPSAAAGHHVPMHQALHGSVGRWDWVEQIGKIIRKGFSKALSTTEKDKSCLIKNNYNTSVGKHASAKSWGLFLF